MEAVQKDLESRKAEILAAMKLLFTTNMKITDWNIPEADDNEAANIIIDILQEALDEIKKDVKDGKYDTY